MENTIKNIVLAEDERGTALLVKRELERHGFNVSLANNGQEALDLIRRQPVDLLITDVVMPEMDGVDLYLELKRHKSTEKLPIIIITDKQMFLESFAALGVDHFVDKASNTDRLIVKIYEIDRLKKEAMHYSKILVCGSQGIIVDQIRLLLQEHECLVSVVPHPTDIVSKAFMMKPNTIILDLMLDGDVSVIEIIRSLRCYDLLKDTAILTYANFSAEEVSGDQNALEMLEERIKVCQGLGVTKYLGRFNRVTFVDSLKEFGVS